MRRARALSVALGLLVVSCARGHDASSGPPAPVPALRVPREQREPPVEFPPQAIGDASARPTALVLPSRARKRKPRAILALHEDGGDPSRFLSSFQRRADRIGVAFVGVSGPTRLGPNAFRWSDDPAENAARIDEAVESVRARVRTGDLRVLLGFGEGAQVALEVAARDPERYAGAIALSPGGASRVREIAKVPGNERQRFVIAFGMLESWEFYASSVDDLYALRDLGARVDLHEAWFYGVHTLPPDFDVQLPKWVAWLHEASRR